MRAQTQDIEAINEWVRGQLDGIAKELLLRVSIKDLCTLLDQKANLNDVNKTLELVQKEVEDSVKGSELK